jgi:hypothetical protein
MPEMKVMLFKTSRIRVDEQGRVCLNDIHRAAGFSKNQRPSDWTANPNTTNMQVALLKQITGKSGNYSKDEIKSVVYTTTGRDGGTWVHENLALSYAEYLSPRLGVEIRDVFLRYKRGDESLVPEIRENRQRQEDVARLEVRNHGKKVRRGFTDTLKERGITLGWQYAQITDVTNQHILGGTAKKIKMERGLPAKAKLRDHLPTNDLAYTMASEALATERIEDQDAQGYSACRNETSLAGQSIKGAIEADRKDRQRRLIR